MTDNTQLAAMLAQEYVETVSTAREELESGGIETSLSILQNLENSMRLLLISTTVDDENQSISH